MLTKTTKPTNLSILMATIWERDRDDISPDRRMQRRMGLSHFCLLFFCIPGLRNITHPFIGLHFITSGTKQHCCCCCYFAVLCFVYWDKASLGSPGWPGIHYAVHTDLKFIMIPLSQFLKLLGFQAQTNTFHFIIIITYTYCHSTPYTIKLLKTHHFI